MPLYDVTCPKCKYTEEVLIHHNKLEYLICADCGSKVTAKVCSHAKTPKQWEVK